MSTTAQTAPAKSKERTEMMARVVQRLHITNNIAIGILCLIAALVALIFIAIIAYLVVQGLPYLFDPAFYGLGNSDAANVISIAPELFNTFYILILTEVLLIPIALAAAIYLIEYAKQGLLVTIIHFAAETLNGVPAIVLGLFGFIAFAVTFHFQVSRLSGALTLLCLNLPLALRLFEDALAAVPRELREGGLALGSTRWHMIRTVVLPSALPGLVTGIILSAGKIIGEAAALIFTMGVKNPVNGVFSLDPSISSDTLTIRLWYVKAQGAGSIAGLTSDKATIVAAGSAALLILILLLINIGARGIGRIVQRRVTAA